MEHIQVRLQAFTDGFTRSMNKAQGQLKKVSANVQGFGQAMKAPVKDLGAMRGRLDGAGAAGRKFGVGLRNMTHGAKGFRMEMLGIMFFGMSLTRIFSSLTRTSMEWMGSTEILSAALGLLFLPTAEKVTDWILIFLDWVGRLTERQKKWIGNIVLVVGALGLILTILGTLALGVGSLIMVFGSFAGVIAAITAVGAVIAGVGLIVWGVIKIIQGKLEGIGLVIMGIGVILLLFIGWWALIPIAVGAAVYWVIKHWQGVKDFFASLWTWLKGIFKKIAQAGKKAFSFTPTGMIYSIGKKILGSFQTGGVVPETGPYTLHKGETVVPTGQPGGAGGMSPTININASISSDYDVRRLADQLKRYWVSDFESVSKGRTA